MAKDAVRLACLSCGQANRVPLAMLESGPKCAKCAMLLAGGDVTSIDAQTHDKATRFDGLPLIVDYRALCAVRVKRWRQSSRKQPNCYISRLGS